MPSQQDDAYWRNRLVEQFFFWIIGAISLVVFFATGKLVGLGLGIICIGIAVGDRWYDKRKGRRP